MRAGFGVNAAFVHAEALDGSPADKMLGDDNLGVFGPHIAIPHRVRIDHHHRAVFALIETAGLVDAHSAGQTGILAQLLQSRVKIAFAVARAGRTRRFRWANVVADEDVAFKYRQAGKLLLGDLTPE